MLVSNHVGATSEACALRRGEGSVSQVADADIGLDRDVFLRTLVRELATSLEAVVGLEEASGYISLVSQGVGNQINDSYTRALAVDRLDREQVAEVLVDLKQRIQGDFYIVEQDDERIVLASRSCPFAEKVVGRESMCMMTSNMFGTIAARNLGYAKVELQETIARGHGRCRVVVHLVPDKQAEEAVGREYYDSAPFEGTGPEPTRVP
ncbi:methanogen output domain 1-containing protein [Streptomyces capparidis]